jgi:hypothetical protein
MPKEVASAEMVRKLRKEFEEFKKSVETVLVTPSGAGNMKPGKSGGLNLDLSGFLTVEDARNAGVQV